MAPLVLASGQRAFLKLRTRGDCRSRQVLVSTTAEGSGTGSSSLNEFASAAGLEGKGLGNLRVDFSRAHLQNPDRQIPEADQKLLEDNLHSCMRILADTGFLSGERGLDPIYLYLHPPVYTCDQADRLRQPSMVGAAPMKNLFVRDKKKNLFLVSTLVDTQVKLGKLRLNGMASGGASFANSDVLFDVLRLIPGSVTPFGLMNDSPANVRHRVAGVSADLANGGGFKPRVTFYLDANALKYDYLAFHPNACNATLDMPLCMFVDFIENVTRHKVNILEVRKQ